MNNKEKYLLVKKAIIVPAVIGGTIGAATKDDDESGVDQFARGAGVGVTTDAGMGLGALLGGGVGAGGGYGLGKLIEAIQGYEPEVDEYGWESPNKTTELLTMLGMLGGGALGAGGGGYGGYRLGRKMLMPYKTDKDKKEEEA